MELLYWSNIFQYSVYRMNLKVHITSHKMMIREKKLELKELLVSEQLILLGINEEKRKFYRKFYADRDLKLAGAILMDLKLLNKIFIEEKIIYLLDSEPVGIDFLDDVLKLLYLEKKLRKLIFWVNKIGREFKSLKFCLINRMKEQNLIEFNQKKQSFFTRYTIINLSELKGEIVREIMEFAYGSKEINEKLYYITCLLSINGMYKNYIPTKAKALPNYQKLITIIKSEVIGQAVRTAIANRRSTE